MDVQSEITFISCNTIKTSAVKWTVTTRAWFVWDLTNHFYMGYETFKHFRHALRHQQQPRRSGTRLSWLAQLADLSDRKKQLYNERNCSFLSARKVLIWPAPLSPTTREPNPQYCAARAKITTPGPPPTGALGTSFSFHWNQF